MTGAWNRGLALWVGGAMISFGMAAQSETSIERNGLKATISIQQDGDLRTYQLSSNAPLRDNLPPEKLVVFSETAEHATVRSGNMMFDGLYAMAVHEAQQDSVSEIQDNAYGNGDPIKLDAFQTGEYWTYVWTRDLAYSVNLGLAGFDPQRSVSSLLFKTSRVKSSVEGGVQNQIIQDTGSGGSYPVSTDRVVWALGAWETLKYLSDGERQSFLRTIYPILRDTIEQDRRLVFDEDTGLYCGEQSFLDWREQTYPAWTRDNVLPIALSKSLSVNVIDYYILSVASDCADQMGRKDDVARYAAWADDLKQAINEHFYDPDAGFYSAYLLSDGMCNVRVKRHDLLADSLAILFGVADQDQAKRIIKNYPVGPHGPSVVWPQERGVPIYHNQGIWPFVTAYWTKAARKVEHADAVNAGIRSMETLAALNLSNMENFDFVSGLAHVEGAERSGPVVNSRRQLWSVAGYLSMVQDVVFGLETSMEGIRFRPFITAQLRNDTFGAAEVIELRCFPYHGTRNTVRIHLPPTGVQEDGALDIHRVLLDGKPVDEGFVSAKKLKAENQWDIQMQITEPADKTDALKVVDVSDDQTLFGPEQPTWNEEEHGGISVDDGQLVLHFQHADSDKVVFNIYRDGMLVAEGIEESRWVDEASSDYLSTVHCYTVEAVDPETGNASHLTPFICYSLEEQNRVLLASDMQNRGGQLVAGHHFEDWGQPRDELVIKSFKVGRSGSYVIRTKFSNGSGPVNTGITCAVKKLEVLDARSGKVVDDGYLIMPQSGNWERWDMSSPICVNLKAGKEYALRISEDDFSRNMSYLEKNERYTSWAGGGDRGYNYVNIAEVHVDLAKQSGELLSKE